MLALPLSIAAHFRLKSLINGLDLPLVIDLVLSIAHRACLQVLGIKQSSDWRMGNHDGGEPSNATNGRIEP